MESRSNDNETTNVLTNTRPKEEGERTKKKSEKADCEARSKADPKTKADRNPRCGSRAVPSSVQIQSWFCYSAPISFNGLPFSLGRGRRAWPPQGAWSAGVRRRGRRCWRGGDWASTCCAAARRRTRRRATAASASPAPWPPPSRCDRRRRRRRRRRVPRCADGEQKMSSLITTIFYSESTIKLDVRMSCSSLGTTDVTKFPFRNENDEIEVLLSYFSISCSRTCQVSKKRGRKI